MSDIRYFNYHNCLVVIHRGECPADVDEAYGAGTYSSLFNYEEESDEEIE